MRVSCSWSTGLKDLFRQKKLPKLVKELEDGTTTYEQYKKRTEAQWLRRLPDCGDDIYNYLNPRREGNEFLIIGLATTMWRATGFINGARKMEFRRGLYRTAQDYLGFYEKRNLVILNPFSYQEDGKLRINVLFEQKSDALHFRAAVYENVSTVSPQSDLTIYLSVEPASDAVLDDSILVGHFQPDNDSPPETPRPLSGVTELYDTSPLFKYQRLEHERLFGGLYKADRAHLIDKPFCEKGKQFAKFQNNENNFLALSKEVHCWFDALSNVSEKIPFFKLLIKNFSSSPDPANDYRYRVLLTVEEYNVETARLLFPRLKDGSIVIDDTHAETLFMSWILKNSMYVHPGRMIRLTLNGISHPQLTNILNWVSLRKRGNRTKQIIKQTNQIIGIRKIDFLY